MGPLDTFRKEPYRHNCAQAIANQWQRLYDNKDIVASYAPYVGGRAPEGLCGALYAATQAMPEKREEIIAEFRSACGAIHCKDIKGGKRTACETCVSTADSILRRLNRQGQSDLTNP